MYDKQFQIQRGRRVQNPALRRPARERRCQLGKRQGEARGHAEIHETALDALKPDLAVYMGDICAASRDDIGMESFKRQFERLIAPVVERKIPFATIMGNHDHDSRLEEETEIL